jgi:hypothetical protein
VCRPLTNARIGGAFKSCSGLEGHRHLAERAAGTAGDAPQTARSIGQAEIERKFKLKEMTINGEPAL